MKNPQTLEECQYRTCLVNRVINNYQDDFDEKPFGFIQIKSKDSFELRDQDVNGGPGGVATHLANKKRFG